METASPSGEAAVSRPEARPSPRLVRAAVIVKQIALALALLASTVLFIDYRNAGDPAFCGVASGCFAVRVSAYSHLGGIPLPHLALPAFAILLGASILARTPEHHRLIAAATGLGALGAIALIAIQAVVIGTFCKWCVIVDTSAIVAAAAAIVAALHVGGSAARAAHASLRVPAAAAWGVAGALAVALPFVWAKYPEVPPAPPEIAAEQRPGKVTIVAFTDFECPFCRKLHPMLGAVREKHGDRIHLVRKMKPLSGHPGAMPAAKAYVCAPEAKRDDVAHALYEAEPEVLTDRKVAALADKLDLGGREAFAACITSKDTLETIERDAAAFGKLGGRGLPFTWVGARVILGADPDRLFSTVDDEITGPHASLPLAAMFAIVGLVFAIAAALSLRAPAVAGEDDAPPRASPGYAPPRAGA